MTSTSTILCRRVGWTALSLFAVTGLVLEALHGWKIAAYLDDALTRELLRLAHAHGVGLALVALAYGEAGVPLLRDGAARRGARSLALGVALVPLGFGLAAIDHPEGDPALAIVLVPIGALLVIHSLALVAIASFRSPREGQDIDSS